MIVAPFSGVSAAAERANQRRMPGVHTHVAVILQQLTCSDAVQRVVGAQKVFLPEPET